MPLYVATVIVKECVWAETEEEAYRLAMEGAGEDLSLGDPSIPDSIILKPVSGLRDVPHGWMNACPWGCNGEKTVEQIVLEDERMKP